MTSRKSKMLWSPSASAFYDPRLTPDAAPADAVAITQARHAQLLDGLSAGGSIVLDRLGRPILKAFAPSAEALAAAARSRRDAEIAALRWMVDRQADQVALGVATFFSAAEFAALLTHLQALRDVPDQPGFPTTIVWPVPPAFIPSPDQETI